MRALTVTDDKKLKISIVPDPEPASDEVLIKVQYAALNRADVMQADGDYPPPPGAPSWPGLEVSGIIAAKGKKVSDKLRVGQKVCALLPGGGYAEYAAAKEGSVMPVPDGITMAEAACLPEVYSTAWLNLFAEGKLKKGETVLVTAGASGVGIAVTQLAKAFGARVIVTLRGQGKIAAISGLGADLIVDTLSTDLASVFASEKVDLVIDCVGGEDAGRCMALLNRGGRWIQIATLAGDNTVVNLKELYKKGVKIIGSTLRSRSPQVKARIIKGLVKDVFPLVESGKIKPVIYSVFGFEDANAAHAQMRANKNIGKILLEL